MSVLSLVPKVGNRAALKQRDEEEDDTGQSSNQHDSIDD
jgi:hypothetical protein